MISDEPEIEATDPTIHPLARIRELLEEDRLADAAILLEFLPPGEQRRIVSRLNREDNTALLGQFTPEAAAELIENLPDELAASLIQDLPTAGAAQIFDELPDDV